VYASVFSNPRIPGLPALLWSSRPGEGYPVPSASKMGPRFSTGAWRRTRLRRS